MSEHHHPVVSVVLPTYNRAQVLPPVIDSILSQDYRDLELIIIDDASTDNTAQLIREIQERDPRVRYVQLPVNRGVGFAREAGLRHARGRYVALADSDDIWLEGKLREQVQALDEHANVDILFGDFWNINHVNGRRHRAFSTSPGVGELVCDRLCGGVFVVRRGMEAALLKSNFVATPTVVLRSPVFDQVGGFSPDLRMSEDLDFWWRAAAFGARFAYLDRPLIERHIHNDSLTAQGDRTWLGQLESLAGIHSACQNLHRRDLLADVRAAQSRAFQNLLRIYGQKGRRRKVVQTFRQSLSLGLSGRMLLWFAVALVGPKAVGAAIRSKAIFRRRGPD